LVSASSWGNLIPPPVIRQDEYPPWYEPGKFRPYVNYLATKGELINLNQEVDSKYEIGKILWRYENETPPKAVMFSKVKGSEIPVVGGLYSNWRRIALALGATGRFTPKEMTEKWFKAINNPFKPIEVHDAPWYDTVIAGDSVNLMKLPIPTIFKSDGGPYITVGTGFCLNPITGVENFGIYRTQVIDEKHLHVWAAPVSDLSEIYKWCEEKGKVLEFAIAIGVDPVITFSSVAKIPHDMSGLAVAGGLIGEHIRIAKCSTVDIYVPTNAEIVIEGRIDPRNKSPEGPFAEFGGLYGRGVAPIMEVTCISMRKKPIFHTAINGPSAEHLTLTEQGFVPFWSTNIKEHLQQRFDCVRDVTIYWRWTMQTIVVAIEKTNESIPRKIIEETFNCENPKYHMPPVSWWARSVIIVDYEYIDIYNLVDVLWAVNSILPDSSRIFLRDKIPSWGFEYMTLGEQRESLRIGIDATKPIGLPREKIERTQVIE